MVGVVGKVTVGINDCGDLELETGYGGYWQHQPNPKLLEDCKITIKDLSSDCTKVQHKGKLSYQQTQFQILNFYRLLVKNL